MKALLCAGFVLFFTNLFSQANFYEWARQTGGSGSDMTHNVITDAAGNVYTTGAFSGTIDFDPGPGTVSLTASGISGYSQIFLTKWDAAGNLIWAKTFPGTGSQVLAPGGFRASIALDSHGSIYLNGAYSGTADLDPGLGVFNVTATTNTDPFVIKLTNNGDFVWGKVFSRTSSGGFDRAWAMDIAVDVDGNVISCGNFEGTWDFNPGTGVNTLAGGTAFLGDSYVSKLDSMGNFVWVRGFLTAGNTEYIIRTLGLDNTGNIYAGGSYYSQFNTATSDPYIIKLNKTNGGNMWQKQMSSSSSIDNIYDLAVDGSGNVFITGSFTSTANFNPDGVHNITSSGGYDVFVSKFTAFGNWMWTKTFGGSNNHDEGTGIYADAAGNIFCSGKFASTPVDFDPGAGTQNISAVGSSDVFALKLDGSGNYQWAKAIAGLGAEVPGDITADGQGNLYLTGNFQGMTDFNPDAATANLTTNGAEDGFIVKLTNCIYNAPDICLVSVDSMANNNMIYWDEDQYPLADSFIVYRYDALSTNFLRIGAVARSNPDNFLIDTARTVGGPNGGDPQYSSYRYKMAIRGVCGDLGTMGRYHESIFIQQNFQNFNWNAYAIEGQPSPATGYQFLRDNTSTNNWQVLVNTGGLSTTDPNYASYPTGNWRVDALGFSCSSDGSSRLIGNGSNQVMGAINTSRSNIKSPTSIGLQELAKQLPVKVYPNPANDQLTVEFPSMSEEVLIEVQNVLGEVIYTQKSNQLKNTISCAGMNAGIYFVSVRSGKGMAIRKITIQ